METKHPHTFINIAPLSPNSDWGSAWIIIDEFEFGYNLKRRLRERGGWMRISGNGLKYIQQIHFGAKISLLCNVQAWEISSWRFWGPASSFYCATPVGQPTKQTAQATTELNRKLRAQNLLDRSTSLAMSHDFTVELNYLTITASWREKALLLTLPEAGSKGQTFSLSCAPAAKNSKWIINYS